MDKKFVFYPANLPVKEFPHDLCTLNWRFVYLPLTVSLKRNIRINYNMKNMLLMLLCPRSLDPIYIVTCRIKCVKTSWTYSIFNGDGAINAYPKGYFQGDLLLGNTRPLLFP